MDDSGLRERVAKLVNAQTWDTCERIADRIISLVDAEYRPLLVQAREALAEVRERERAAFVAGAVAPVNGIAWDDEATRNRTRWAKAEALKRYGGEA